MRLPKKLTPPKTTDEQTLTRHEQAQLMEIATAFQAEVTSQAAFFLTGWTKGKDRPSVNQAPKDSSERRHLSEKDAASAPLQPGDFIYIVNGNQGSPLSGHVATVIKEVPMMELPATDAKAGTVISKIYWVSGNSRGVVNREGAVRVEEVFREIPHPKFQYYATAEVGNAFDAKKGAVDKIKNQEAKNYTQKLYPLFFPVGQKMAQDKKANKPHALQWLPGKKIFLQFFNENVYNLSVMESVFAHYGVDFAEYRKLVEERNTDITPRLNDAQQKVDDYRDEKHREGQPVSRRPENDAKYDRLNAQSDGEATGRYSPLKPDHSWVVSIVRSSQLDAARITRQIEEHRNAIVETNQMIDEADSGEENLVSMFRGLGINLSKHDENDEKYAESLLSSYGLERMSGSIEENWPGAMDYWENAGAFR